ncbi:MAG TPA: hypothetical protein VJT73_00050 [Polyangiaceae bacterium]|nr:hypothetical protein [Polyangiaceae bacterium]
MVSVLAAALLATNPAIEVALTPPAAVETDPPSAAVENPPPAKFAFAPWTLTQVGSDKTSVAVNASSAAPDWGYAPLRVSVDNGSGPRQKMTLSFIPNDNLEPVTKTIDLEAGERRSFVLPVPVEYHYGRIEAHAPSINEREGAHVYLGSRGNAQRLVLSLGTEEEFERAVGLLSARSPADASARVRVVTLPIALAPLELAAYVGFDAVTVPHAALDALSDGARRALEAYAATGGVVIAPNAGRQSAEYFPLATPKPGQLVDYGLGAVLSCPSCGKLPFSDVEAGALRHQIAAHPKSPAPDNHESRLDDDPDDDTFIGAALLPQARAPMGTFMSIIFVFTLLIGPGSIWVARRRGPVALLVTIPGTAFVTCLLIVSWSLAKDGFTIHASSHGYTELDSRHHRAITAGVTAYYANLAPSKTQFDALTAVIGSGGGGYGREDYGAALDWGASIAAGRAFLPSRTYREWGYLAVLPTRARITLKPGPSGPVLQNALGLNIERIVVATAGQLYEVRKLGDGAEATATPLAESGEFPGELWGDDRMSRPTLERRNRKLEGGEFLATVDGSGFLPSGGLTPNHHKSTHVVRGAFE